MLDLFVDIGFRRIWSKSRMGLGFICDVLHDNHGLHAAGGCTCAQAKEGRGSGEGWGSRDQYSWLENPRRIIEAHSPSQISTHPRFKPVTFLLWHCLKFLAKIYPFSQKEYAKHLQKFLDIQPNTQIPNIQLSSYWICSQARIFQARWWAWDQELKFSFPVTK